MAVDSRVLALVPKLRDWANAKPMIKGMWIHGSQARGDQRGDDHPKPSDLDLAIDVGFVPACERDSFWNDVFVGWRDELQEIVRPYKAHAELMGTVRESVAACSITVYEK
jgi:predicted nucleotidyltransferase